jgi:phosphate starvation-inducible membrane PsiE
MSQALHHLKIFCFYLELGTMTGIYFKTHRISAIFLIFMAITRFLVIDMKSLVANDKFNLLIMVVSILILSVVAGVLKFTEKKYQTQSEH